LAELLEKLEPARSPERLRQWRALEALEGIGTPGACQVLRQVGEGAPGARLTQEAKASLQRLAKRAMARP
jgi:hypothetical protein